MDGKLGGEQKKIMKKQSELNDNAAEEAAVEAAAAVAARERDRERTLINYTIWERVISMLWRLWTQKMSRITFLLETNWNIN